MRGWDDGAGVDTSRAFGSTQGDAIRNIQGSAKYVVNDHTSGTESANGALSWGGYTSGTGYYSVVGFRDNPVVLKFDLNGVVPTADENRPKNIALLPCIKY
ncbi:hypothetical protein AGMMS49957_10400 [Synergistales bacterium]|nr:hypothetical protein AGMMS49957_10400 [Synergistales bacterium]